MLAFHDADVGKPANMAAGAVAGVASVVDRCGFPACHGVAGIAGLGGRHMSRRALTRRQGAVVAGCAHRDAGLGVVEFATGLPLQREFIMAKLALIRSAQTLQMVTTQTTGYDTVVTGHATVYDIRVTDCGGSPRHDRMTNIAVFDCRNVIRRFDGRNSSSPVVTYRAASNNAL